jgi:hypothetical protein
MPQTTPDWVLAVTALAICGVFSVAIAAWLVRELGRAALERSAQEDVPQVLAALGALLDKLSLLLPWSRRDRRSLPAVPAGDAASRNTEAAEDLLEGGAR